MRAFLLALALALPPFASPSALAKPDERPKRAAVVVNGVALTRAELEGVKRLVGGQVPPGRYWYDRTSGLVGRIGEPAAGQIAPGLPIGGPLSRNASGRSSRTGVYLNGREIHPQEATLWTALVGPAKGRFWLRADGSFGRVGGPALGNLQLLMAQKAEMLAAMLGSARGAPEPGTGGNGYFRGRAEVGGMPFVSGTFDESGQGNHVISVDGEVLDLPN